MLGKITEVDKLILLYQYETQGELEPESVLDISDEEARFIRTSGEYILWESGKRDFDYPEVANSHWLETTYRGQAARLDCLQSRDAVLCPLLFSSQFHGEWHIHNGFLRMNIESSHHQMELFSVANENSNIHSLLLFKDNQLKGAANITLMV
ncbi:hypothetical protein HWV00_08240 [Moritella sp. 24]|uniref:hypothetical protein n=1 Tax=Moritella sp. 24 TaxID=2746230 RepID=UPI001BA9DC84|nr:hypothetical protein [Moritella sp. 24]QUM76210.1 hypothetical protein HWV00_08240 [Moritella sp. 24]